MKRYIRLVGVTVGLVASCVYAGAYQEYGGIEWNYFTVDDEFAVIGVNEGPAVKQDVSGAISTPTELGGLPVTRIGVYAFRDCTNITSLFVSEGVSDIRHSAFYNCTSLGELWLPTTLRGLASSAFYGCEKLRSLRVPNGTQILNDSLFIGCRSLAEITLPSTLEIVSRNDLSDTIVWKDHLRGGAVILNGCAIDVDGGAESIVLGSECKCLAYDLFHESAHSSRLKDLIVLCEKPKILAPTNVDIAKELFSDAGDKVTIFVPKDSLTWRDQIQDGKWLNQNVVGVALGDDGLLAVYDEAIPGMRIVSYGPLMTAGEYVTKQVGRTITLPDAPSKELYDFEGWECDGILYAPGEQVVCMSDVVPIVAKWKKRVLDPPEIIAPTNYFGTGFWFEIKTKEEGAKIFYKVEDARGRSSGTLYYDGRQYRTEETVIYAWVEKNGYFPSEEVVVRCVPAARAVVRVQESYEGDWVCHNSYVGADFVLPDPPSTHELIGWRIEGVEYGKGEVITIQSPEVFVYAIWGREKSVSPKIVAEKQFYSQSMQVEIMCSDVDVEVWYGLKYDGSEYVYKRYEGAFSVTATVEICSWSVKTGYAKSDIAYLYSEQAQRVPVFVSNSYNDDWELDENAYAFLGGSITLPVAPPSDGLIFSGWRVGTYEADSGTKYQPGDIVNVKSNQIYISPIWSVRVMFDLNGLQATLSETEVMLEAPGGYVYAPTVKITDGESQLLGWAESKYGDILSIDKYSRLILKPFKTSTTLYAIKKGSFKVVDRSEGDGVIIIGRYGDVYGTLEIPSEIDGNVVREIGSYAFQKQYGIGSVHIPDTICEIGYAAFAGCNSVAYYFEGDAPLVSAAGSFSGGVCYAYSDTSGWDAVDSYGRWNGLTLILRERDPIPDLGDNPTQVQIRQALEGSADQRIKLNITDPEAYNSYRKWAGLVKDVSGAVVGPSVVKSSPYAWASFATDSAVLLAKMPTDDDLKVEEFKPSAMAGSFDFTVSVKDVKIGDKASVDNLKKLFELEGAESLDAAAFSSEKVSLDFKEPQDGKLKFSATPAVDNAKSFFMKAKVK